MAKLTLTVTTRGPLFKKDTSQVIRAALVEEVFDKIAPRVQRGGRGLGAKRNTITQDRVGKILTMHSTLIKPRVVGKSWTRKNIAIIRAMTKRVLNKAVKRMAEELS